MLLTTVEQNSPEISSPLTNLELEQQQNLVEIDPNRPQPFCFQHHFTDAMLMGADIKTVGKYLDSHQGWFTRCAQPMQVEQLGRNGYALTIGKFKSFGYAIEPKIGLELLPQDSGIYRIKTIDIPNYQPPGYEVSFNAEMRLVETVAGTQLGTKVDWNLDLMVSIQFPKFIHKLPKRAIQNTGDGLLKQIVTQVSRRLTHKVQQDFHGNLGVKIPKKG
jgi:hypothetical protein